jgi:hypothetical protein
MTTAPRRVAAAIHRFAIVDVDPFVLGLFRVALALYILLFYVMLAPSWLFYYGPHGITPVEREAITSYQLLNPILWYVRSDGAMWLFYAASVPAAILLALGVWWRAALVWLWFMNLALLYTNPYVINGEEQVLALLLLFALFMPLGESFTWRQLSTRAARRAMLLAEREVRVWTLTVLQVHLMFVYLVSLPDKLADSSWRDGTLVYYAMMAIDYPRWPGIDVFAWGNAALSRVLTAFSLAVELLVPILIWFRRLRLPCIAAAMALHAGLGLLIEGVMMFNGAMMVALILFLPSRRTRTWLAARFTDRPEAG